MDKPTLVADVRSILRRSLPDSIQGNDSLPLDDRLYYCSRDWSRDQHRDATTAWVHRQRRREDILDEISELETPVDFGSISASD
jgi:hypothetical protein